MLKLKRLLVQKKIKASYSIIEISIALAVMGIVMTVTLVNVGLYLSMVKIKETRSDVDLAAKFLMEYAAVNGRLPCPADPSDDNYTETQCDCSSKLTGDVACYGLPEFVVGALPVSSMSGNRIKGVDAWGYKLIYVVSSKLTKFTKTSIKSGESGLFINVSGIVDVAPDVSNSTEAAFAIVSAGVSHLGAWGKDGMVPCNNSNPEEIINKNNCSYNRKDFSLMYFADIRVKDGKVKARDSKGDGVFLYNNIISWRSIMDYNILAVK
ncbi:hypothetical protein CAXC1_180005 [Candidatus Xenohaliotis californiensis]|uniref:Prepilin-type N-terminal cleavage/methylation domain-containing protein n=1 Tax=Candidatus Xenohaliotis californiensis TaxID=84677 RepID=A0ABM9N7E0_9RICK|nr:hypothetical protein CAXC1_180005 [Candidatus Xenohaliotis californiensis]